ncbi:MAG: PfkB family carbohydrate kinase [Anaerolineaceae bacterium]|jgi:sugar/nucleoside kinase (ribokinase family)|nr:PfkB family carbohydrate kinase [Anaerolineaceae bacterium]MDD4042945.1 PfkB family carbohydrate kinase [Anaerolineaceae bacterium]MDD4577341.1 PfkB family carbohydrate kinase [Anaerolineaceae bacterium]
MTNTSRIEPIDYLLIGHVTSDLQSDGSTKLGGTASFSGVTAHQLGHKVGILSSHAENEHLYALSAIQVFNASPGQTTCFRNITTPAGRQQYCYQRGSILSAKDVPAAWRDAPIVHLGPVAGEIAPDLFDAFPGSLLCCTPQGMLRAIAEDGKVTFQDYPDKERLLPKADAIVLSFEDLQRDEALIEKYASLCKLLVVTENKDGARVYWKQEMRSFAAPEKDSLDETGAGDIFAACFFHRLHATQDPWEAARFAVELSAISVTRVYLESVPSLEEIEQARRQVV